MGLIADVIARNAERQRREEFAKFVVDVEAAGDRERALDVVKNYSSRFLSIKDYDDAFKAVDNFYPASSKEVKQVPIYDENTGQATTTYLPSGEAVQLTPEEVKRRYGPGATLTRPDMETFYKKPGETGETEVLGRFPINKRPEGAVTLPELESERRFRAERRAERNVKLGEERLALMQERWARSMEKLGSVLEDKELKSGRAFINDAVRTTAMSLNARILPDGSWQFDDDNRVALFNNRLRYIENLIEVQPDILKKPTAGITLSQEAAKAYPLTSETPKPPEKPKAEPKKGALSRAASAIKSAVTGEPDAKKPADGDVAEQINARASEINKRTDLMPEQKKAALDKLREIARKNKAKVGF